MSLLVLDHVAKRHGRGARAVGVLEGISFELAAGELVAVWGMRHSGRSTLLRVAAGIEPPDSGSVRFDGHDVYGSGRGVGGGIAFCHRAFAAGEGRGVLDQLTSTQEALGVSGRAALVRARRALERAGASQCATLRVGDLAGGECVRVALARALLTEPRLVVLDDPELGVALTERDDLLALLREIADSGCAVLLATGDSPWLTGADRALTIGGGALRGELAPGLAEVLPLRAGRRSAA